MRDESESIAVLLSSLSVLYLFLCLPPPSPLDYWLLLWILYIDFLPVVPSICKYAVAWLQQSYIYVPVSCEGSGNVMWFLSCVGRNPVFVCGAVWRMCVWIPVFISYTHVIMWLSQIELKHMITTPSLLKQFFQYSDFFHEPVLTFVVLFCFWGDRVGWGGGVGVVVV